LLDFTGLIVKDYQRPNRKVLHAKAWGRRSIGGRSF